MSDIDETIVSVTVTRDTRAPTQAGFGVPMIAAHHTVFPELAKAFGSDLSELTDEGFTTAHPVYRAASAMLAQDPTIEGFVVGRLATGVAQVVNWIPSELTVGFVHRLRINSTWYEYEVQDSDTVALVVDGMLTAATAAADVSLSDEATHLEITADDEEDVIEIEAGNGSGLEDVTAATNVADELAAIETYTGANAALSWYGLYLTQNSAPRITAAATFVESITAQLFVDSADAEIADAGVTDDIASALQDASRTRTVGLYHTKIGQFAAAGWLALHLAYQPGIATMANKTISGPTVDALTGGEKAAINAKNFSHYTTVGGTNVTFEAKTPAGEYADIVRDIDFSTARIKEAVFALLTGNAKVPFTDTGAQMVRGAVHGVLRLCSSADHPIFDPESIEVTVPLVATVSAADRANRLLPSVRYSARLQGAIHKVRVTGHVTV